MPDNVEMLRPGIRRYTESFSMWRINRSRAYLVEGGGAREVSHQSVSAVRLVLHYALNDHLITSQHHAAMVVNRYTKAETTILQECTILVWSTRPQRGSSGREESKTGEGLGGGSAENFAAGPIPFPGWNLVWHIFLSLYRKVHTILLACSRGVIFFFTFASKQQIFNR